MWIVLSVDSVDTKTAHNTQQRHIAHRVRIDWGLHLTQTYPGSFLRFVTKDDGWGVWQCSHVYIFVTGAKQHSPCRHNLLGWGQLTGIQKYFPFNQSMKVIGYTLWWRALTGTFSLDCVWLLNHENSLYIKIIISSLSDWVLRISIHHKSSDVSTDWSASVRPVTRTFRARFPHENKKN